jgi:hypothetical protein
MKLSRNAWISRSLQSIWWKIKAVLKEVSRRIEEYLPYPENHRSESSTPNQPIQISDSNSPFLNKFPSFSYLISTSPPSSTWKIHPPSTANSTKKTKTWAQSNPTTAMNPSKKNLAKATTSVKPSTSWSYSKSSSSSAARKFVSRDPNNYAKPTKNCWLLISSASSSSKKTISSWRSQNSTTKTSSNNWMHNLSSKEKVRRNFRAK